MKHLPRTLLSLLLIAAGLPLHAQRKTCIDQQWQFFYGDGSAALANWSITKQWRTLDLPHDWSVETEAARLAGGTFIGPFSTNSVGKYQTGHTVGGEGWYMKKLTIEKGKLKWEDGRAQELSIIDAQLSVYFEGAYNETDVWVNGRHVCFNPYGYSSFRADITHALHEGDNSLLVRVKNLGNNTRWYAGSGIYRHVWLERTPLLHAVEWDTYVRTDNMKLKENGNLAVGEISVETSVRNDQNAPARCNVSIDITDTRGLTVASAHTTLTVAAGQSQPVKLSLPVADAQTWSPDTPFLYIANIRVSDGHATDSLSKTFGVRTLKFTATDGFLLNGRHTLLRGGCIHHDNGLLGAAAYDRAEDRKLALLKSQGYNAVRCSHNLPSEHFLDACDAIGMMVIDETFDQWLRKKNNDDYHRYFAEYSDRDIATMVRRDRNHPSVIMWSIGNEIPGRIEPEGLAVAERLRRDIQELDTSRPVTAAICGWDEGDGWNAAGHNWDQQCAKAFSSLDVGGYNYLYDKYESDHAAHPDRVMLGTESYPKQLSENWDLAERLPYVVGDFIWTAMDYLGEAGIGSASIRKEGNQSMFQPWPWYNGWCGDIDLIGQKKPQSYYHDVVWRRQPVTMGVERPVPAGSHQSVSAWGWQLEEQSWTYNDLSERDTMTVNVYSRSPKVSLYLNGELLGSRTTSSTFWAAFRVPYRPGTLRAETAEGQHFDLVTTGAPAAIRLVADRNAINADGQDLAYITIELTDAQGRVITSDSHVQVSLSATGTGTLLAAGNASPTDMESFRSTQPRLYQGRALAILKSSRQAGTITLTAKAEGLPAATVTISTLQR